MSSLDVERLTMRFGGLTAISDLSFRARSSEVTAIIGPNGAGKTTLFNCLTGFYRPTAGKLKLSRDRGKALELERMPAYRIARDARVIRTFQNARLFAGMSVLENLIVAQHADIVWKTANPLGAVIGSSRYRGAMRKARDNAERCRELVPQVMYDCDVLLTAAAAGEAPVGLALTGDASFCLTWTTTHVPCITLPVFKGPHGLPIGLQLVARRNADRALFAAARWVYNVLT